MPTATAIGLVLHAGHRPRFEEAAHTLTGVTLILATYEQESEIRERVAGLLRAERLDGLLLGLVPYARSRDLLPPELPVAITRSAALDLSLAWSRARGNGWPATPVSIDTFTRETVDEVATALDLDRDAIACLPFDPDQPIGEVVAFHRAHLARTGARYVITVRTGVAAALVGDVAPSPTATPGRHAAPSNDARLPDQATPDDQAAPSAQAGRRDQAAPGAEVARRDQAAPGDRAAPGDDAASDGQVRAGGAVEVLHALATPGTIRADLHELALRIRNKRADARRFAAGVFMIAKAGAGRDLDRARVGLLHLLLNTPDFADAWIDHRGRRGVVVFAHAALFEAATRQWVSLPVLAEARAALGVRAVAGFGLGGSARLCVALAERAAARAEQDAEPGAYLISDSGLMIGPMGTSGTPLAYTYRAHGDLESLAARVGLSAATLSRLAAIERAREGRPLSPGDLAQELGITDPSGRRLIRKLAAARLVVAEGSSQLHRKGRPTRLYRLAITTQPPQDPATTAEPAEKPTTAAPATTPVERPTTAKPTGCPVASDPPETPASLSVLRGGRVREL